MKTSLLVISAVVLSGCAAEETSPFICLGAGLEPPSLPGETLVGVSGHVLGIGGLQRSDEWLVVSVIQEQSTLVVQGGGMLRCLSLGRWEWVDVVGLEGDQLFVTLANDGDSFARTYDLNDLRLLEERRGINIQERKGDISILAQGAGLAWESGTQSHPLPLHHEGRELIQARIDRDTVYALYAGENSQILQTNPSSAVLRPTLGAEFVAWDFLVHEGSFLATDFQTTWAWYRGGWKEIGQPLYAPVGGHVLSGSKAAFSAFYDSSRSQPGFILQDLETGVERRLFDIRHPDRETDGLRLGSRLLQQDILTFVVEDENQVWIQELRV